MARIQQGTPKKAKDPLYTNPLRDLHRDAKALYRRRFYLLGKVSPRDGEMRGSFYEVKRVLGDHQGRRYQELNTGTLVRVKNGHGFAKARRREEERDFRAFLRDGIRRLKRENGGRRVNLSVTVGDGAA